MTALVAPKGKKLFRLDRRFGDGSATYICVDADGSELLTISADGSRFSNILVGWCPDGAFGSPPCAWPECPQRNSPVRDQEDHGEAVSQAGAFGAVQTRKDTAAVAPFGAMPPPPPPVETSVQDVIDEPVESAPVPVVEPVPEVSTEVQQAAEALAFEVWSSGSIPRDHLFAGLLPALADEYLNQAIAMQWVVIDGDRIAPGAVSPEPMTALPSERSSRGWLF
jgi:hypothetical protein